MKRYLWVVVMSSLVALPAASVWLLWAEPAQWIMTERGLMMTQELAAGQFDVVAKFTMIGLVSGLMIGLVVAFALRPATWRNVPVALGSATLAAGLCWLLGRVLGPSDPSAANGVPVGELVSTQFAVDTWPAFLAWPLMSLFVIAVFIYMSDDPASVVSDSESAPSRPE